MIMKSRSKLIRIVQVNCISQAIQIDMIRKVKIGIMNL